MSKTFSPASGYARNSLTVRFGQLGGVQWPVNPIGYGDSRPPQVLRRGDNTCCGPQTVEAVGAAQTLLHTGSQLPDPVPFFNPQEQTRSLCKRFGKHFHFEEELVRGLLEEDACIHRQREALGDQFLGNRLASHPIGGGKSVLFFPCGEGGDAIGAAMGEGGPWAESGRETEAGDGDAVEMESGKERRLCYVTDPNGEFIHQLALSPWGNGGGSSALLAARSRYAVQFYEASWASGGADLAVTPVATMCHPKRVSHVCWNPMIRGEAVTVLENGSAQAFQIERQASGAPPRVHARSVLPQAPKSRLEEEAAAHRRRFLPEVPKEDEWWRAEFCGHPRTLLVADRQGVTLADLRQRGDATWTNGSRLVDVQDFHETSKLAVNKRGPVALHKYMPLERVWALASSASQSCSGTPSTNGFEFAIATEGLGYVMLFDMRRTQSPVLQWEHRMGKDPPQLLLMCPLSALRQHPPSPSAGAGSGHAILAASFGSGDVRCFPYGPNLSRASCPPPGEKRRGSARAETSADASSSRVMPRGELLMADAPQAWGLPFWIEAPAQCKFGRWEEWVRQAPTWSMAERPPGATLSRVLAQAGTSEGLLSGLVLLPCLSASSAPPPSSPEAEARSPRTSPPGGSGTEASAAVGKERTVPSFSLVQLTGRGEVRGRDYVMRALGRKSEGRTEEAGEEQVAEIGGQSEEPRHEEEVVGDAAALRKQMTRLCNISHVASYTRDRVVWGEGGPAQSSGFARGQSGDEDDREAGEGRQQPMSSGGDGFRASEEAGVGVGRRGVRSEDVRRGGHRSKVVGDEAVGGPGRGPSSSAGAGFEESEEQEGRQGGVVFWPLRRERKTGPAGAAQGSQAHMGRGADDSEAHMGDGAEDSQAHMGGGAGGSQAHMGRSAGDSQAHMGRDAGGSEAHMGGGAGDSQAHMGGGADRLQAVVRRVKDIAGRIDSPLTMLELTQVVRRAQLPSHVAAITAAHMPVLTRKTPLERRRWMRIQSKYGTSSSDSGDEDDNEDVQSEDEPEDDIRNMSDAAEPPQGEDVETAGGETPLPGNQSQQRARQGAEERSPGESAIWACDERALDVVTRDAMRHILRQDVSESEGGQVAASGGASPLRDENTTKKRKKGTPAKTNKKRKEKGLTFGLRLPLPAAAELTCGCAVRGRGGERTDGRLGGVSSAGFVADEDVERAVDLLVAENRRGKWHDDAEDEENVNLDDDRGEKGRSGWSPYGSANWKAECLRATDAARELHTHKVGTSDRLVSRTPSRTVPLRDVLDTCRTTRGEDEEGGGAMLGGSFAGEQEEGGRFENILGKYEMRGHSRRVVCRLRENQGEQEQVGGPKVQQLHVPLREGLHEGEAPLGVGLLRHDWLTFLTSLPSQDRRAEKRSSTGVEAEETEDDFDLARSPALGMPTSSFRDRWPSSVAASDRRYHPGTQRKTVRFDLDSQETVRLHQDDDIDRHMSQPQHNTHPDWSTPRRHGRGF